RVVPAGNVIDEERLLGGSRVETFLVLDGVVRHVGGQVVTLIADPRKNLGVVAKEVRGPLVGLAAHEAVEIIEAHAARPLVVRPRQAVLKAGRVVIFAEPRCGKPVVSQNRPNGGALRPDDGVVAWKAGRQFANDAEAHGVVVAAGDEGSARRRAKCRGMELRVTQARLGDAIHRRRRDDAAESTRYAV